MNPYYVKRIGDYIVPDAQGHPVAMRREALIWRDPDEGLGYGDDSGSYVGRIKEVAIRIGGPTGKITIYHDMDIAQAALLFAIHDADA